MAQEVPPFDRLPPDSQQWGRWATGRIQSLQDSSASALSNLQAQNQSLAAQLNRLQLQVANLSVQQSYAVSENVTTNTTSSGNFLYFNGISLPFSLDQSARVRISGNMSYNGFAVVTSGTGGSMDGSIGVGIDGSPTPLSKFVARARTGLSALGGSGLSTQLQISSTPTFSATVTLDAGSHVVELLAPYTYAVFFGSSGNVSFANCSVSVDVLGVA